MLTPLAPHGGVCPPLVTGPESRVTILLDPGNGGARIELDGQVHATLEPRVQATFALRLEPEFATLVSLGEEESLIAGLRRRRILTDSPRVLARDDREAQSGGRSQPPSDDSSSARERQQRALGAARADQLNADGQPRGAARMTGTHTAGSPSALAYVASVSLPPGRIGTPSSSAGQRPPSGGATSGAHGHSATGCSREPRVGLALVAREPRRGVEVVREARRPGAARLAEHLLQVGRELGVAVADDGAARWPRSRRRGSMS